MDRPIVSSEQPELTTVVVLSLAPAIALNTTMYSVLDAVAHPRLAAFVAALVPAMRATRVDPTESLRND